MNQKKDNEFDRQLRGKFESFTPEVSTDLWGKIEAQLDAGAQDKVVPMAGRRKGLPAWLKAAAAVLVIMGGVAYWYSRPVEVTYLHGPAIVQEDEQEVRTIVDENEQPPVEVAEPLDVERLKRLFAKKERRNDGATPAPAEEEQAAEERAPEAEEPVLQWAAVGEKQAPVDEPVAALPEDTSIEKMETAVGLEEALAKIPDVQPLVVLDDEEETMLASADGKQAFGLSNILNYVVGTVDQREEKLVTFSNDNEGSLKLDFNFGLAKNKKKKMK